MFATDEGVLTPNQGPQVVPRSAQPRAGVVRRVKRLTEALGRELRELDPETLTVAEAQELMAPLALAERQTASAVVRCGARAATVTMRQEGGDRAAAEWFARQTGRTRRQAEAALHLAEVAHEAPGAERAWADGELTVDQADQVVDATRCAPGREDDLLELARRAPAEELRREARKVVRESRQETDDEQHARLHRRRRLSTWTNDDGEWEGRFAATTTQATGIVVSIELCAEAAFRRARREGRREPLAAHRLDGLSLMAHLATGGHPADLGYELADLPAALRPPLDEAPDEDDPFADHDVSTSPDTAVPHPADRQGTLVPDADLEPPTDRVALPPQAPDGSPGRRYRARGPGRPLCVLVADLAAIRRGECLPGERCEVPGIGPVPVAHARELLGEGLLRLAIRDGVDVRTVVHPRRRPNVHQMTALLARYDECCVSGCTTRAALQVDHDHPWADTHETWLPNLKRVCPHHHARKTNQGWDWVVEPPDPLTGKHRLVAPGDPDHPLVTKAAKATPTRPADPPVGARASPAPSGR